MRIYGVVTAANEKQADAILMDLVNENILDFFELDGRENISDDEINNQYDAVVDQDGLLNLSEDYDCPLSEVTAGAHTFGFEAEYCG